jgi:hypothetical protein
MIGDCTMRVEGSMVGPFQYSTTFVVDGPAESMSPLTAHHLYGDGDLAVFLEDIGITVPLILRTLNQLKTHGSAQATVRVRREMLEVLSGHRSVSSS